MFHRLCATTLAVLVLLSASACTDPRETRRAAERSALSSQLQEADSARSLASQAVAAQARRVEALSKELSDVQSKAVNHKRAIEAFMLDHKMAVAALAAGAAGGVIVLDDSGRFTQAARAIAAAMGLAALGWALFNMDEVLQVAGELSEAESTQQALSTQANTLAQDLVSQREALQQLEAGYQRFEQQAAGIRTALQAL